MITPDRFLKGIGKQIRHYSYRAFNEKAIDINTLNTWVKTAQEIEALPFSAGEEEQGRINVPGSIPKPAGKTGRKRTCKPNK